MRVVFPPSVHAEVVGYVVKPIGGSKIGGGAACSDGKNRSSSQITERNVEDALGGCDEGEVDTGAAVVHAASEVVLRGSSHLAHQQPQQRHSRANSRDFAAAV